MGEANIDVIREGRPPDILQDSIENKQFVDDLESGRLLGLSSSLESYKSKPTSVQRVEDSSIVHTGTHFTEDLNVYKIKLQQEISKRENCEKQITELNHELQETRKALCISLSVEDDMCEAVVQLQQAWEYFGYQWTECDELEDTRLTNVKDDCENGRLTDTSILPVFTEDCLKETYAAKKENRDCSKEGSRPPFEHGKKEHHTSFELKTRAMVKEEEEIAETEQFLVARKGLMVKGKHLELFKREQMGLKEEIKKNEDKLKEIDRRMHSLNQQRLSLLSTQNEIHRRECWIENEIRLLYNCMDKINKNIREYLIKELQQVNDNFQYHEFNSALSMKEMDCKSVNNRNRPATDTCSPNGPSKQILMEHKHEEEIKSYQLELKNAMQKIRKLEAQLLNCNLMFGCKEKVHHGKEVKQHWPKYGPIVNEDDSLVIDGTEPSMQQDVGMKKTKEHNRKGASDFKNSVSCEIVTDIHKTLNNNNLQLEKTISDLFKKQCDHVKEQIEIIIREEMKHTVPVSDGNNEQQNTLENIIEKQLSIPQERCRIDNPTDIQCSTENEEEIQLLDFVDLDYLHYGSFTAYSYFYGYLELVLKAYPFGPEHSKGFTERINTYINRHNLPEDSFPVTKLFIVVPLSLDAPINVEDDSVDDHSKEAAHWLEVAAPLETLEFDVAGVRKRTYNVPVYKLKDPSSRKRPKYVAVAVGLKSLFDVFRFNAEDSEFFRINMEEIISKFCKALKAIIQENHQCKDFCEIIYFGRTDSNGKRINLAKVILKRITHLLKEKNEWSKLLQHARRRSNYNVNRMDI